MTRVSLTSSRDFAISIAVSEGPRMLSLYSLYYDPVIIYVYIGRETGKSLPRRRRHFLARALQIKAELSTHIHM